MEQKRCISCGRPTNNALCKVCGEAKEYAFPKRMRIQSKLEYMLDIDGNKNQYIAKISGKKIILKKNMLLIRNILD